MITVIRNARVLTMDGADSEHACATVTIEGDRIAAVEPGRSVPGASSADVREIDGAGHLLMPGLVNAHCHSSANHLKGAFDSLPLEIFMLYESPPEGVAMDPRAVYVRTLLGAAEMLRSGVTAVLDDAFFVPAPTPAVIDAVLQAYADSGLRATVALDQPNVPELDKLPFLADLLPPGLRARAAAPPAMEAPALLECYAHLIKTWHGREGGRLRAAVSCSAPQRVTPEYFAALEALSRGHDLPFFIHVLETKLQRVFGLEKLGGRSLIRYVADLGFLSERAHLIHGVWLDEADLELIAAAGAVVAHNPISNLRLGSGIMPFRALRERGIPICLGSDEAITDDAINLWSVAKLAGLIHNITAADYERWPTATEILDCLIRGGARALRSPVPIGAIAPGYQADLVMLDLDTLAFTPLNDLRRQLVYCESGSSVRLTMVAGRVVFEEGRLCNIDEAALRREARAQAQRLESSQAGAAAAAGEWLPYYREIYLKAAATDVGLRRCSGDRDG
jgi:cytosine/adenosine deaminase-related metal-dependent hydrolase